MLDHDVICALLDTRRYSYEVIARMCNTTRGTVGGLAFRRRHPRHTLVYGETKRDGLKTGRGWQEPSYYPSKHAKNTR